MATVHRQIDEADDDAASVSSVPESHYEGDSDSDDDEDMIQALSAPLATTLAPVLSPKEREAQAEREAALRNARSGQSSRRHNRSAVPDDDVPPPPYTEAPAGATPVVSPVPVNSQPTTEHEAQVDEHSPVLENPPLASYGSITPQTRGGPHEAGYSDGPSPAAYQDHPDANGPQSGPQLEAQKKNGKKHARWCGIGRRKRSNDPNDDPRWLKRDDQLKRRRRRMRWFIIVVLLIGPLAYLFDVFATQGFNEAVPDRSKKQPSTSPTTTAGPQPPSTTGTAPLPTKTAPSSPPWPQPDPDAPFSHRETYCSGAIWSSFFTETASRRNLAVYELWKKQSITGAIRIVPAPPSQVQPVVMSIAFAVLPEYKVSGVGFSMDKNSIKVDEPQVEHADTGRVATDYLCADADFVMSVRPDTSLDHLLINSYSMGIKIYPGVFANDTWEDGLYVSDTISLRTTANSISVASLSAPFIEVGSGAGSVRGTFALYKTVHISSVSGTIDVEIQPKDAPRDDPTHPAELDIRSSAGSIRAHMPVSGKIPNRIYRTTIKSTSGSSTGELIFGDKGDISSNSGSLKWDLLPYIFALDRKVTLPASPSTPNTPFEPAEPAKPAEPVEPGPAAPSSPAPKEPSWPSFDPYFGDEAVHDTKAKCGDYRTWPLALSTETTSSSIRLNILEPYHPFASDCEYTLASSHKSNAGSLRVSYPDSWSGAIHAESMAGSIHILGEHVVRLRNFWNWLLGIGESGAWLRLDANGDVHDSAVDLKTTSSSITLQFGDV